MPLHQIAVWNDELNDFELISRNIGLCNKCGFDETYVDLDHNILEEDWWRVVCSVCGNTGKWRLGLDRAVKDWNWRE